MDWEDYEVGYKKPPRHTRFQKGVCANPAGRRGKKDLSERGAFQKILGRRVPYSAKGRRKKATRLEILIKQKIGSTLKGDIKSSIALLNMHAKLSNVSSDNVDIVEFTGGTGLRWDEPWVKISER